MSLRADTGEVWNFINYLCNFRDDVCVELENNLKNSKAMREKLMDSCNSKEAIKLAEEIEDQEDTLLRKEKAFKSSCLRSIKKLHTFLLYLESVGTKSISTGNRNGDNNAKATDSEGDRDGGSVIVFRSIEFRDMESFEETEDNLRRLDGGHPPIGKDGLYVNLHHSLQVEEGPIWELSQTKHQKWHRALHINPSSIPSGINRSAFAMLRKDYWKYRGAIIRRRLGR